MAKEKTTTTKPAESAPKPTRTKRPAATPQDVKAQTQEAKDLRTIVQALSQKNSPESSKDITAMANETLKIVAKSQKSDSAAFRREATKALIDFRNFVEQTTKVTETRRAQLLSKIDNASLDTKNAAMMLMSVAKTQAKNVRLSAAREAQARKLEIKEMEKKVLAEAKAEAVKVVEEARLKSKMMKEEQSAKLKNISEERRTKIKLWADEKKQKLEEKSQKLKEQKEKHAADIAERKDDLAQSKSKSRNHYKNIRQQLKDEAEARKKKFEVEKVKKQADLAQQSLELKTARADAAAKIKKLKNDLRDDYQTKMRAARADIAKKKAEQVDMRKNRMARLKQVDAQHKAKLKQIIDDAKTDSLMRKRVFKQRMAEEDRLNAERSKARGELGNKVKEGIYEANPLLHAAIEIGAGIGIHTMFKKMANDRKQKKALNRLNHNPQAGKPATATPQQGGGATAPGTAPNASNAQGGGFFGGLASGVAGLISGVGSMFSGIMGAFAKVGPLLMNGARFLPGIAQVAAIVYGIWNFIEGFNDATSLFGEKIEDSDYVRRIFSGFTNVFSSILGIFDKVAGWLGFDTDLEGSFRKNAVKVFNAIVNTFKSLLGGVADLLSYIPGMGSTAKSLKAYADSPTPGDFKPSQNSTAAALNSKTNAVNDLKDQVDAKKAKGGAVQVVQDNSVKQSSTTIVQTKMDTRNGDSTVRMYSGNPIANLA